MGGLLLWAQPADGAFSLVDHTKANMSATTSGTSGSITVSAGDLLLGCGAWYQGIGTVSDSQSGSYTQLTAKGPGANDAHTALFYRVVSVGGSITLTIAQGASNGYGALTVLALSGVDTVTPFDAESGNAINPVGTTIQPGSITPAADNELLVDCLGTVRNVGMTATIDSSFASPPTEQVVEASGVNIGSAISYLIETTATAKNPTWTLSASSERSATQAAFKAAAGGGGGGGATPSSGGLMTLGVGMSILLTLGTVGILLYGSVRLAQGAQDVYLWWQDRSYHAANYREQQTVARLEVENQERERVLRNRSK